MTKPAALSVYIDLLHDLLAFRNRTDVPNKADMETCGRGSCLLSLTTDSCSAVLCLSASFKSSTQSSADTGGKEASRV